MAFITKTPLDWNKSVVAGSTCIDIHGYNSWYFFPRQQGCNPRCALGPKQVTCVDYAHAALVKGAVWAPSASTVSKWPTLAAALVLLTPAEAGAALLLHQLSLVGAGKVPGSAKEGVEGVSGQGRRHASPEKQYPSPFPQVMQPRFGWRSILGSAPAI